MTRIPLALLLAAGMVSTAHARPGFGPGGPGGNFAMNPVAGLDHRAEQLIRSLDVSDAQKAQIRAAVDARRAQLRDLSDAMRANRRALHQLDPQDPAYMAEVERLAAEHGGLAADLVRFRAEMRLSLTSILTEAQRAELRSRAGKRRQARLDAR